MTYFLTTSPSQGRAKHKGLFDSRPLSNEDTVSFMNMSLSVWKMSVIDLPFI